MSSTNKMFSTFTFLVGSRYGISRKHSRLVSFISRLSTAGLVIGVALLIVVMSVMNGFDRELRERILGIMPQATIYHREGIVDYPELIKQLKRDPRILEAAPFVQIQGLFSYEKHVAPVNLFGVNPELETKISTMEEYLPPGTFTQLAKNPNAVIVGQGIADKLHLNVGDNITVIIPTGIDGASASGILTLEVIATLKSNTNVDQSLALMNLAAAAQASGFPDRVNGIRLKVDDLFAAQSIVISAVNQLPVGYFGSDWTRTHGTIYDAIHMSKNLVGLLLFLIIGIAAFNLVSTLIMVVVDKQGDIAILRTLGASSKEIIGIFMVQGGLIGFIGTGIGAILGVLFSLIVTDVISGIEKLIGFQFLHSDVYPISYLPSNLYWSDVAQVVAVSLFICFFAALYPAWRASRVQPADALRYE